MKDLRDWYSYLERASQPSALTSRPPQAPPASSPASSVAVPLPRAVRPPIPRRAAPVPRSTARGRLPAELAAPARRRPGRPALTETREEIIQRLLDPELTLHEAAALLNVSKATLRRYTDQGRVSCYRTAGGQRRFKLSNVLALLETTAGGVGRR